MDCVVKEHKRKRSRVRRHTRHLTSKGERAKTVLNSRNGSGDELLKRSFKAFHPDHSLRKIKIHHNKSGKSQGIPLSGFKPRQQSLINSKLQKNGSYSEEWHTTHGIDMGYTLTLNKLEKSGWKRKSHKVSPEDRLSTNSVYISPDGKYKAIAITSGDILRKNHHQSIEIKKV